MKKWGWIFCMLLQQAQGQNLARFVDPFIGTGGHGHTFPGATVPFGMVQLSPDTRVDGSWDGCSGYHYSDSFIYGFSHTHLSGTGVSDYGDILLMPYMGEETTDPRLYGSDFSHHNEDAAAGYYRVMLKDSVYCELTATERTGHHRYIFPRFKEVRKPANLIIDLRHRDELIDGDIQVLDEYRIQGYRMSKAWAKDQHVYFAMRFSQKIKEGESVSLADKAHVLNLRLGKIKKWDTLHVEVGISFTSMEGAWKNLQAEGAEFDQVKDDASQKWNEALSRILVPGNDSIRTIFYTALYHTMIHPNVANDVDGKYRGHDGNIHALEAGKRHYTVFSLWDTFRATHPLYNLIIPERSREFVESMLRIYQQAGRLPVWELCANETDCMIGYHAASVIADAWVKGIRDFDAALALKAMKKSATWNHLGLPSFNQNSQITIDDEHESVSKTLEYAYDHWCVAVMADSLNEDAQQWYQLAQSWKNLFDAESGFMRPKKNGDWLNPFFPEEVNNHFTEANSWQYSFFVPHDVYGLVNAFGGASAFEAHLDALFETTSALKGRHQVDITGLIGQYAHGNEPSHHMAFLYNYIQKPFKTQQRTMQILKELYSARPDGLSGNEDCGQMSAWYVWAAIGMYPVCPGTVNYAITCPIFDTISIQPEKGEAIYIQREGKGKYAHHPRWNGKDQMFFISHDALKEGGAMRFSMSDSSTYHPSRYPYLFDPSPLVPSKLEIVRVPLIRTDARTFNDSLEVVLIDPSNCARMEYSMNGGDWVLYSEPFTINRTALISARAVKNGKHSGEAQAQFNRIDHSFQVEVLSAYNPQYSAGGPQGLMDGIQGSENWRKGSWMGVQGEDFVVIIDLQETQPIRQVSIGALKDIRSWIFWPSQIIVETASKKGEWELFDSASLQNHPEPDQPEVMRVNLNAESVKNARYLRVTAKSFGKIPSWHPGAGNDTFIFIDEVQIGQD